jgi:uncharacterized protein (DUF302 family)
VAAWLSTVEETMTDTSLRKTIDQDYDAVLARVPEVLKAEGFGVLTRIDVQATLREKLGTEFRRYQILGACNPPLAHRALSTSLELGVMLPCNVIVYDQLDGRTVVSAVDPTRSLAAMVPSPALEAIAGEVRAKLERVIAAL